MPTHIFAVVIILVSFFENLNAFPDLPKTNSIKTPPPTPQSYYHKKTLTDLLNQDYQEMYKEMMRINHESREITSAEDTRLRRIVGEDNFELLKDGSVSRRRGGPAIRSAAGKRRARSQAVRREKLNSQGLRSHLEHARRSRDYSFEASSSD